MVTDQAGHTEDGMRWPAALALPLIRGVAGVCTAPVSMPTGPGGQDLGRPPYHFAVRLAMQLYFQHLEAFNSLRASSLDPKSLALWGSCWFCLGSPFCGPLVGGLCCWVCVLALLLWLCGTPYVGCCDKCVRSEIFMWCLFEVFLRCCFLVACLVWQLLLSTILASSCGLELSHPPTLPCVNSLGGWIGGLPLIYCRTCAHRILNESGFRPMLASHWLGPGKSCQTRIDSSVKHDSCHVAVRLCNMKGEFDDVDSDVLGRLVLNVSVCQSVTCLAPTVDTGWLALMSNFPRLQNNPQFNLGYFHCNDVLLGRLSFWCQTEAPFHFDARLAMPVYFQRLESFVHSFRLVPVYLSDLHWIQCRAWFISCWCQTLQFPWKESWMMLILMSWAGWFWTCLSVSLAVSHVSSTNLGRWVACITVRLPKTPKLSTV